VIHYLTGQWEWVRTTGGKSGTNIFTPQSRGYTMRFIFSTLEGSKDSVAYSFYLNDTLQWNRNAGLSYSKSIYGDKWNLTDLYGELNYKTVSIFVLSNDSLSLADNCYDCYQHQFYKQRKENLTGIPSPINKQSKIYPNPCQTSFRVSFGGQPGFDHLRLSNLNGQTVKELANSRGEVDVSGVEPGVYILNAKKGSQQMREKLIVR
jgi:hypothetical protein